MESRSVAALFLAPCIAAQPPVFERLRDIVSSARILAVNGETITPGLAERRALHLFCADLLRERVLARMLANECAGRGRDVPELDDEECEVHGEAAAQRLESRFPNASQDVVERVRRACGTSELLIDTLYLTHDANGELPDITYEILRAQVSPKDTDDFLVNVRKTRPLPPFWMQLLRGWLRKGIYARAKIEWPWDGVPAPICMRAEGEDWATVELWNEFAIQPEQLRLAMALLVVEKALGQELRSLDAELSDAEFERLYKAAHPDTVGFPAGPISPIPAGDRFHPLEFRTTYGNGVFQQLWRQRLAHDAHAGEVRDGELTASVDALRRRVVAIDWIQFTARDLSTGAWRDSLSVARSRAEKVAASIRLGAGFEKAREDHGEWFLGDQHRGTLDRCGGVDVLRENFGENEITDLVLGPSAAEEIFLRAKIGEVVGPLPTPSGAVIARVRSRTVTGKPFGNDHPVVRERAKWTRFLRWARGVLEKTHIEVVR